MSSLKNLVGKNIRKIRKQCHLTQEQLAELSGLQNTYIGGVERGERNISMDTLERIVVGLQVRPEELFRLPSHKEETDSKTSQPFPTPIDSNLSFVHESVKPFDSHLQVPLREDQTIEKIMKMLESCTDEKANAIYEIVKIVTDLEENK